MNMHSNSVRHLVNWFCFLPCLWLVACSGSANVSLTEMTPSEIFFVDFANPGTNVQITRTSPYFGENSSCPHQGAHIHFLQNGESELGLVDIVAPFDGVVDEIKSCKDIGASDGFEINLRFADPAYASVKFDMSIEPQDGFHCVADQGGEANFYEPYIFVAEGDTVLAGEIIGQLPIVSTTDDGAHVHFNLRTNTSLACPNIFSDAVTEDFAALYGGMPCETPTTNTFCYGPSATEDLTGLDTETP